MSQEQSKIIENPVMNVEETKSALDYLTSTLKFTPEFVTVTQDFKNIKFGIEYMVRIGKVLSGELEEWCNSTPCKKIFIRLIFIHPSSKKTFLEAVIKARLYPEGTIEIDSDDESKQKNNNSEIVVNQSNFSISKKYYLRKMSELDPSVLEDDFVLSDDSTTVQLKTLCEDSEGLLRVEQKMFWDVIKYLIYHESILEYKVLVENAENFKNKKMC